MKMKTTLLTIAMLTVTGSMIAAMSQGPMGMMGSVPKELMPSADMQKAAGSFYSQIEGLTIPTDKQGVPTIPTVQLNAPARLVQHIQNTFSVAKDMVKDGDAIEKLHIAYAQIPYFCPGETNELTKLMGGNSDFMSKLTVYGKAMKANQTLLNELWQAISTRPDSGTINPSTFMQAITSEDKTTALAQLNQLMAPVTATAQQKATAEKILNQLLPSNADLKTKLAALQTMFKGAKQNAALAKTMNEIEYLVKQDIQWMFALHSAINPDFAKSITEEATNTLTTTLMNLHTSPKVVALKKQLATAHAAEMINAAK